MDIDLKKVHPAGEWALGLPKSCKQHIWNETEEFESIVFQRCSLCGRVRPRLI